MKVAIINYYLRLKDYPTRFSLSTLRLAEYLNSMNIDVELIPISLDTKNLGDFIIKTIKGRFDIVGISHYVWSKDISPKLARMIKNIDSTIKIIVGGPEVQHVSVDEVEGDYFIVGEGEQTLVNVINHIGNSENDETFFKNNPNVFNKKNPNWQKVEHDVKYANPLFTKFSDIDKEFLYYETSRGCAYKCGYCGFRNRENIFNFPLDFVKEEIIRIGNLGFKEVFVIDANLGGTKERAKIILQYFNQYAPNTLLTIYIRPEFVDDELIMIMRECNLKDVRIGIQTLNNNVPNWLRSNSLYHITKELPKLSEFNIPWKAELIIGLPGDNLEGLKYSIDFTEKILKPKEYCCYPLTVIKDTPLYELTQKSKNELFWIRADEQSRAIESSSYTNKELLLMQEYAKIRMNMYLQQSNILDDEKKLKMERNKITYKGID